MADREKAMRSSKRRGGADQSSGEISGHILILHQRLQQALNLGTRSNENKRRKWQSSDIEIQRHVVRSIAAFLESISKETLKHQLVKDSLGDIVGALIWILQYKNGALLSISANVALKLVKLVSSSWLKSYGLDFVHPLSSLLSSQQREVVMSSASALNLILSSLTAMNERQVWEILKETETIPHITNKVQEFSGRTFPSEYVQQMLSLLSTILCQMTPSRSLVWNDDKLMKTLKDDSYLKLDLSVTAIVFKLYCAIALCGIGAEKILEQGELFMEMMVQCMSSSYPHSVRIEAFRLAQRLARNERGCLKIMGLCCEPIVKVIISTMSVMSSRSTTNRNDQISLLEEACRLGALTARWAGKHHTCFWKHRVDRVLLDLVIESYPEKLKQNTLSNEEQIEIAMVGLKANHLPGLRVYIWDFLGWISTHFEEDFHPDRHLNGHHIDMLITCACLTFWYTDSNRRVTCQGDMLESSKKESAFRAVLMTIYSPCNFITSKARSILSKLRHPIHPVYLKGLLRTMSPTPSENLFCMSNIDVNLRSLACCLTLPQYRTIVLQNDGIKTLFSFIEWYVDNEGHVERRGHSPHLYHKAHEKNCCWVCEENWEGENLVLFHSLLALSELLHHSDPSFNRNRDSYPSDELTRKLKEICISNNASGVKWYAANILTYFGFYGFPSKLGERIGKSLNEKEFSDFQLILVNKESLSVHGVILAARCDSLLPLARTQKEVCLSVHVKHEVLVKLLEYVYLGYVQAGEEIVKKLKSLAKNCNLQPLLQMLYRKRPKWGMPFPSPNFAIALGQAGFDFGDVILEAKSTERKCWTCQYCTLLMPHLHAHKVILWARCDYLRALLQAGMLESNSNIIKVPISLEATIKLVEWFYSDELPNPPSECLWNNMDTKAKLVEMQQYIELCWLSDFWFLENVHEKCMEVIISRLESSTYLAVNIICIAADFSLWKLAEITADYIAPLYSQFRDSGELEALDETLLDLVRSASVRLSQEEDPLPT